MKRFTSVTDVIHWWGIILVKSFIHSKDIEGGAFDLPSVSSIWTMNSTLCSLQHYLQQQVQKSPTLCEFHCGSLQILQYNLAANRKFNLNI